MTTQTIPQHIQEKANNAIAKGTKMTFEAICEMFMKSEAKEAKKRGSKSDAKKWEQRKAVENTVASNNPNEWLAEKNRENAMKNLPSSLR